MRTDADLQVLRAAVPIGGEYWSDRLVTNLRTRFTNIRAELQRNRSHRSHGSGVVEVIQRCLQLYERIAEIRRDHFPDMERRRQQLFVTLMVEIFVYLSDDSDQYANSANPQYAGKGFSPSEDCSRV